MSKPNLIQIFFWNCAGSTVSILKRQETEYAKHTVLGMAVFLTAALAFFTGKSVFHICFGDKAEGLSIISGMIWAIIIFNIDRSFIINASSQSGGWTLVLFCTRFFMAGLISLSLSTVIELEIFQTEIKEELKNIFVHEFKTNHAKDITDIQAIVKKKEADTKTAKINYDQQVIQSAKTIDKMTSFIPTEKDRGKSTTLRDDARNTSKNVKTFLQIYKSKLEEESASKKKLDDLNSEVSVESIQNKYAGKIANLSKEAGLMDRYKALKNIIENRKLQDLSNVLTLLMAMVEISPLLLKTMYPKGNYEKMIEERSKKDKDKYIKVLNFEEKRFDKIIDITYGRLNLDENFADSKLNPSNLRISNRLDRSTEDNLNSNLDSEKLKEFLLYTAEEKKEINAQVSHPRNAGFLSDIHNRLDELKKKFDEMGNEKKFAFFATFAVFGLAAKNAQDIITVVEKITSWVHF
jgi:hypothetical protein